MPHAGVASLPVPRRHDYSPCLLRSRSSFGDWGQACSQRLQLGEMFSLVVGQVRRDLPDTLGSIDLELAGALPFGRRQRTEQPDQLEPLRGEEVELLVQAQRLHDRVRPYQLY